MAAPLSPRRFAAVAAASALLSLGLIWLWVLTMPMAFLDREYPSWAAKEAMLRSCALAPVLVLGDSRAAADIMPTRLKMRVSNLAVGGGETIEAYAALKRALACPRTPARVIVSLDPGHFMRPDLFWERSVRFGFLSRADLTQLRRASIRLHDMSLYDLRNTDGVPPRLRALLYELRFPSHDVASLIHAGVFLRLWGNRARLARVSGDGGQYFFGTDPGSSAVAEDAHLGPFRPLPILDFYFDRMLALLAARHIPVDFIAMPVNRATAAATSPARRRGFAAYLAAYAARYPNFRVAEPLFTAWPDRLFGDTFSHLNPAGAPLLTARLPACLRAPETACDLTWPDPALLVENNAAPAGKSEKRG